MHTAADQLDHMVYGTATNMPGQGDHDCVQALLMDITGVRPRVHNVIVLEANLLVSILYNTGSQTPATINLGGAIIYLDRGYAKEI